MYIVLFRSFPVSGHMLSEKALRKVMYHTAHCLSAIFMIFLHLLMTVMTNVNSGFVSLHSVQSGKQALADLYANTLMHLRTSLPAVIIPYMVISSISAIFLAALPGTALCRSDNQLKSGRLDNAP